MSRYYSRTENRRIRKQSRHNQSIGSVIPNRLPGNQMSAHDLAMEIEAQQMFQEQESFDSAEALATTQQGETA